jgi:hypothetical protein
MAYVLTNPNSRRIMEIADSLVGLRMVDPTVAFDGSRYVFGGYRADKEDGLAVGITIDEIDASNLKFEGYFQ